MGPRWFGRLATLAVTSGALVAFVACDDGSYGDSYVQGRGRDRCENPVRQCQTYCQDWCDAWGYCYPYCEDQCWTDCDDSRATGAASDASTAALDGSASTADAGASTANDGGGALCTPCATNNDCQQDALCIFYGVPTSTADAATDPDAAAPPASSTSASFCGAACSSAVPCPTGFTCATLGARQQCVPSAGRCQ